MASEISDPTSIMELSDSDFGPIRLLMAHLDNASAVAGVESLEFHAVVNGEKVVIGWGESGDPCLLVREPDAELRCECGWRGVGNHYHDRRMGKA